jgi:phospholipid transport system substrate-binding protein
MRVLLRGLTVVLLSAVWLASAGMATAGPPTDTVRQVTDQVLSILDDPQLRGPEKEALRHERLRQISERAFSWQEMAQRALATHWRERTPQERQEFTALFREQVERTYMSQLEQAAEERQAIQYVGEQVDGSRAVVKTRAFSKRNVEVPIDYRLHQVDGRWLIYDVIVEGISLVNNYRSQFNQIITSSSYENLIQRMKSRQTEDPTAKPARRGP